MMWGARLASCLLLLNPSLGALAQDRRAVKPTNERQAILNAIRPLAAARLQQPVRIVVRRFTRLDAWAVVEGELVGVANRSIKWKLASECEPELDKMLFVVLHRERSTWQASQLAVCATEPPYWDAQFLQTTTAPCALFKGLLTATGEDLGEQCGRRRRGLETP
jgi:hypothetical protein